MYFCGTIAAQSCNSDVSNTATPQLKKVFYSTNSIIPQIKFVANALFCLDYCSFETTFRHFED